jgi:hypothetical protein
MWGYPDNQDVGLEAATIQRVRNSSLVKWPCAENVTGLKPDTKNLMITDVPQSFIYAQRTAPAWRHRSALFLKIMMISVPCGFMMWKQKNRIWSAGIQ